MASNILIYDGSPSFFPGETPFGLYDNDQAFQSDAEKITDWCAKRLGYPIVDIELQDQNFFACFEESVSEYSSQVNYFNIKEWWFNKKLQNVRNKFVKKYCDWGVDFFN